jgi:hypothetical protein
VAESGHIAGARSAEPDIIWTVGDVGFVRGLGDDG